MNYVKILNFLNNNSLHSFLDLTYISYCDQNQKILIKSFANVKDFGLVVPCNPCYESLSQSFILSTVHYIYTTSCLLLPSKWKIHVVPGPLKWPLLNTIQSKAKRKNLHSTTGNGEMFPYCPANFTEAREFF